MLCYVYLLFFLTQNIYATTDWAEKKLNQMSLTEKIGQLFMVSTAVSFDQKEDALRQTLEKCPYDMRYDHIEDLIKNYHVGGIIFLFKGIPEQQIALTNRFQQLSKIPLLIGQDCEWGLSMRLYNTIAYPKNMTLGALANKNHLYELGQEIGKQCKALGVHINFAPVVDVNNNPENPVINVRSFGEQPEQVAKNASELMRGMQAAGILACAKHFPGHGDTNIDSHEALPIISKTWQELQATEIKPFKKLIDDGVAAIMTAHLHVPALDEIEHQSATLSYNIVTKILENELKFNGLKITDGMGMQAITNHFEPGMAEYKAFLAGCDIILCPVAPEKAISLIEHAVRSGKISMEKLDKRVLKILKTKEQLGLTSYKPIAPEQTLKTLNQTVAYSLQKKLFEQAITVVKNNHDILPLTTLKNSALLQLGTGLETFIEEIKNHGLTHIYQVASPSTQNLENIMDKLKTYETVVVTLGGMNKFKAQNYGISQEILNTLTRLQQEGKKIILPLFAIPYSLSLFGDQDAIIMAYEDEPAAQKAAAQVILGKLNAKGKLPVTACHKFPAGHGIIL